jgi:hypothetical protein
MKTHSEAVAAGEGGAAIRGGGAGVLPGELGQVVEHGESDLLSDLCR